MQGADQGKQVRLGRAVIATSLLYAAAHPPLGFGILAWIALAPVMAVLLDPVSPVGSRRAATAGFGFGLLTTWLLVVPWGWPAALEWFAGSTPRAFGFLATLPLLASGVAFYTALAFALIARLAGLGAFTGILGAASLWALAEVARSSLGVGNPWGSLAAALAPAVPTSAFGALAAEQVVVGLLGLGGATLVSFVAAASGSALGLAWAKRGNVAERGRALGVGTLVVFVSIAAGSLAHEFAPLRELRVIPEEPLRVALVQGGIGGSRLWNSGGAARSFDRHVELTRASELDGADLVVWSENALPFLLDANVERREQLQALAVEVGAALLVGGSRSGPSPEGGGRVAVYNSAFLFPADGAPPLAYDKRLLLPYVERVPAWAATLLDSPWRGAFASGSGPMVFDVKGWRVSPLLCFEAIYEGPAVERVRGGADLLVNLSNDSWFDDGAGPEQHFALAALRTAETRRPMVRVTTTGVSALVGEEGLLSWRLPTGTGAIALLDVVPPHHDSVFTRGGGAAILALLALIATAAVALPSILAAAAARERSHGANHE